MGFRVCRKPCKFDSRKIAWSDLRAGKATTMNRMIRYGAVLLLLCCSGVIQAAAETLAAARNHGERIFVGKEVIVGRIEGHASKLAPSLSRCVNCHAAAPQSKLESRSAPLLNRTSLVDPRPRRGGPASSYDKTSFCNTLRTGVDPQYVTLLRAMPRFELSDVQCTALWSYLMDPSHDKR